MRTVMVMERHQEKQYYTLNVRPVTGRWFLEQEGFCWGGGTQKGQEARGTRSGPLEQPGVAIGIQMVSRVRRPLRAREGIWTPQSVRFFLSVSAFVFATAGRQERHLCLRKTRRSFVSKQPWLQV